MVRYKYKFFRYEYRGDELEQVLDMLFRDIPEMDMFKNKEVVDIDVVDSVHNNWDDNCVVIKVKYRDM